MTETLLGGQALIEGVMMKNGSNIGVAVRKPDKTIATKYSTFTSLLQKYKFLNVPFVRGPIAVIEMMVLGYSALNYSAKVNTDQEESTNQSAIWFSIAIVVISLLMALFIFKAIPLFLAELVKQVIVLDQTWFSIVEGIFKIGVFIGYILLISLMPDIYRVWQYHGAEHKTIRCMEIHGKATPELAKKCSRLHPRCGTSFVVFIIILSIFVYIWIPIDWPTWAKLTARIALLPIIAGVSFEILRVAGRFPNSIIFKIISFPGLATQLLTTKEPDKKQLQVAIAALKCAKVNV